MLKHSVITSRDNPIIKLAGLLQKSGRSRKENGLFVIEGLRLCRDAAENGFEFRYFLFTKKAFECHQEAIETIASLARETMEVGEDAFAKISDTKTPQGMLCICSLPQKDRDIPANGRYIALQNLSNPANLGAIARTAEALGLKGLILSKDSCDPFSPKALRASMGALLRIPVIIPKDFELAMKTCGMPLYSCVVTATAEDVKRISFEDSAVVLIGNEANGLTQEIIDLSRPITIRMSGNAESLNAAVAASIVMWEMQR